MISLVKNLICISRLNIHYYPNRRYKSYTTSLKAAIVGKSLISVGPDIDRILHFVFMIKCSKFTDNIESGNFTDTFCQNTDKFQNSAGVLLPPLDTPLQVTMKLPIITTSRSKPKAQKFQHLCDDYGNIIWCDNHLREIKRMWMVEEENIFIRGVFRTLSNF